MTKRPVIVSGVQSSGHIHIGNFLGAIQNWVTHQNNYECYVFVADLHALTVPGVISPENLRQSRIDAAIVYLACGIDPKKTQIFCQSDVPEHAYAGWLMTCASPIGWLERMTQFKSKSSSGDRETSGAGLLTYPALQAADIVLYEANFVPTGDDQKQHIEYTRDLVERFNQLYRLNLAVPSPMIEVTGARIMGLDSPTSKMSKSLAREKPAHAIYLTDDDDTIRKKIRKATTDCGTSVQREGAGPGVRNLVEIYTATRQIPAQQGWVELTGLTYGSLKDAIASTLIERLLPIRQEIRNLSQNRDIVERILAEGAIQASCAAARTLTKIKAAVGLERCIT